MIKDVTSENFQSEVLDQSGVVLIDIWAEWCGPCKRMNPVFSSLSDQYGDKLLIAKIDADTEFGTEVLKNLRVTGLPTMFLYVNGKQIKRIVGVQPRSALEKLISEHVITQL